MACDGSLDTMDDLRAKGADGDAKIERQRHVLTAIADNRIEGIPPSGPALEEICAAYVRGEIEAQDLVKVYQEGQSAAVVAVKPAASDAPPQRPHNADL
jgi:formaldehyde-activating enzyme involved in methanogenesis